MYDPNRPHVNDYKYRDLPFQEKLAQSERDAMLYDIQQSLKAQQNNNSSSTYYSSSTSHSIPTGTGYYLTSNNYTKKDLRKLDRLESYSFSLLTPTFLALFATVIVGVAVMFNSTTDDNLPFYISAGFLVVFGGLHIIVNVIKAYMQTEYYIQKHHDEVVRENKELVKRTKH